jgi:hypothetical protein
MRKNGTATMIDRNADINLNVWFREGLGSFRETERLRLLIKSKEETHVYEKAWRHDVQNNGGHA